MEKVYSVTCKTKKKNPKGFLQVGTHKVDHVLKSYLMSESVINTEVKGDKGMAHLVVVEIVEAEQVSKKSKKTQD